MYNIDNNQMRTLMKTLKTLFDIDSDAVIKDIQNDSRKASRNSLFTAYTGFEVDLHDFIGNAYQNGCRAFLIDQKHLARLSREYPDAVFAPSEDLMRDNAKAILEFYGHPDKELCLIGVTGTNGKTTTASLINQSLRMLGCKTSFFGTVEWLVDDTVLPAPNTTPDMLELVKYLRESADIGVTHVVMEETLEGIVPSPVSVLWEDGRFINHRQT